MTIREYIAILSQLDQDADASEVIAALVKAWFTANEENIKATFRAIADKSITTTNENSYTRNFYDGYNDSPF